MDTTDRDRHRLIIQRTDATVDLPLDRAVYEALIQRHDEPDTWSTVERDTDTDYVALHERAHRRWREKFGPVYTEVEPLGPTDEGTPGGDAQLSTAYGRRFTRLFSDGEYHGVVDIECYVVNANPATDPPRPLLTMLMSFTTCTDPDDPGSTEVQAWTLTRDHPHPEHGPVPGDAEAYSLCAAFDHTDMIWDGTPPHL